MRNAIFDYFDLQDNDYHPQTERLDSSFSELNDEILSAFNTSDNKENQCSACNQNVVVYSCPGRKGDPCPFVQQYCESCKGNLKAGDYCAGCREPGQLRRLPDNQLMFCQDCNRPPLCRQQLNVCTVCGRKVCEDCAVVFEAYRDGNGFVCFADHEDGITGFETMCWNVALKACAEIKGLITSLKQKSSKPTLLQQKRLMSFGRLFVAVNRSLLYDLSEHMLHTVRRVNCFLRSHELGPCITKTESSRIHLPPEKIAGFVLEVAKHEGAIDTAACAALAGTSRGRHAVNRRVRLRTDEQPTAIVFLLYDLKQSHPTNQLLHDGLLHLLEHRADLEVYILALQQPASVEDDSNQLVRQLCDAFKSKSKFILARSDEIRHKLHGIQPDLLVDVIGAQHGAPEPRQRARSGVDAVCIVHYLSDCHLMFNKQSFDYFVVDGTIANALPLAGAPDGPAAEREATLPIACWMPCLAWVLLCRLLSIPGAQRKTSNDDFNIYAPISLDRADSWFLQLLFQLAMEIKVVVLYFEVNPLLCASKVRCMAREFAVTAGLDHAKSAEFVRQHVRFVRWQPLQSHMVFLKRNMHAAINGSFYLGHTGHSAALGANLPVITFEGGSGDFSFPSWPGASMNRFAGLSALIVRDGSFQAKLKQVVNLVRQLVEDETLRNAGSAGLERQMRERRAFFCPHRCMEDLAEVAKWVRTKEFERGEAPAEGRFITVQPEPELYEVGLNGKLALAQELGSEPGAARVVATSGSRSPKVDDLFEGSALDNLALGPVQLLDHSTACSPDGCKCQDSEGVGPMPFRFKHVTPPNEEAIIARWPASYRKIPVNMDPELYEELRYGGHKEISEILTGYGCCVLSGEELKLLVPSEVISSALKKQGEMLQETPSVLKLSIFQDPPREDGAVCAGEHTKRMTNTLHSNHKLAVLGQAVVDALLGPGSHHLVKCNLLNNDKSQVEHVQAEHADLQAHDMPAPRGRDADGVDEINLRQLANPDASPLVFLMNTSDGPIRLVVYIASHKVAVAANLLFARHYAAYQAAWRGQPENGDKPASAFRPVWDAYSAAHLAERFPEHAANPIQPLALVLQPLDTAVMVGSFVHAGTSDVGTRLFWSSIASLRYLNELGFSAEQFQFPPEPAKADPSQTSVVLAGMSRRLTPSPEAIANPDYPERVIREELSEFIRTFLRRARRRLKQVHGLAMEALKGSVANGEYQLTDVAVSIGSAESHPWFSGVFGVMCMCRGEGKRRAMIFLEHKDMQDNHNSAILRGAAMSTDVWRHYRRDEVPPLTIFESVTKLQLEGHEPKAPVPVIYRSIVQMNGVPMLRYFKEHFADDCSRRILTDQFRWFVRAFFECVWKMHRAQFRFVTLNLNCFTYDPRNDTVQCVQLGFGTIVHTSSDAFRENPQPVLTTRFPTQAYVGASKSEIPSSVHPRRLKQWKELQQSEAGSDEEVSDGDETGFESVVNFLPAHLKSMTARNRGRKVGQLASAELYLHSRETTIQPGSDAALDGEALRVFDWEQVVLTIYAWFCPFPRDKSQQSLWRRSLQTIVSQPVAQAELTMAGLLQRKKAPQFNQPAALGRLANLFVRGLHPEKQGAFINAAPTADFCELPVHTSSREREQSSEGTRMTVVVDVFPEDAVWMRQARESLQKAGVLETDRAILPREARLKREEGKGNGIICCGVWPAGSFGGWYVGNFQRTGRGRYAVKIPGFGFCDGEAGRKLTVEWLLKHGLIGVFMNGEQNHRLTNMILCRDQYFVYTTPEGVVQVWIPLKVGNKDIKDQPAVWPYPHEAVAGGNRQD
jgi:hypothetical protein